MGNELLKNGGNLGNCMDYFGMENEHSFSENNDFLIEHCNVDNLESFGKYKNRIFYFDGSLQMLENPIRTLKLIMKVTDFIIFTRIDNSIDNSLKIPENRKYKWGGMKNKSNCWFFLWIF